jgi:CdiI immunity protein
MMASALEHLLGAYLHPDWRMDYPDSLAAVADFARSEPDSAPKLRTEVTSLLSRGLSESELREYLRSEMDSWYLPDGDGWSSCRAWLLAAADRVDEVLHRSPAA